jgi:plastocyanin
MQYVGSARAWCRLALAGIFAAVAGQSLLHAADVHARLVPLTPLKLARSAVIWLEPVQRTGEPAVAPGKFTLLQKNKTFTPHLLVVPVGSSVAFPNADPFFHNVFSLFDGKRFDLGLYEAGSTRSVVFSREGVSYIFCNIHSEMSAVVIALDTSFYSIADQHGTFRLTGIPDGDYDLHIWAEGQPQSSLDQLTKRVHVLGADVNLGDIHAGKAKQEHLNKFGQHYDPNAVPTY